MRCRLVGIRLSSRVVADISSASPLSLQRTQTLKSTEQTAQEFALCWRLPEHNHNGVLSTQGRSRSACDELLADRNLRGRFILHHATGSFQQLYTRVVVRCTSSCQSQWRLAKLPDTTQRASGSSVDGVPGELVPWAAEGAYSVDRIDVGLRVEKQLGDLGSAKGASLVQCGISYLRPHTRSMQTVARVAPTLHAWRRRGCDNAPSPGQRSQSTLPR